jgi:hypothetical protein
VNEPLQQFLDARLPLPGIVACAIRQPDRSLITRRDGDALTTAQVEQIVGRLALAVEGLRRHRMEGQSLCWTFDRARIHLTRRADGATLIVFSENNPEAKPAEGVWHLLNAFHEASPAWPPPARP